MTINAIETKYKGYQFRSRLEAKWAAFFDLCEWPWSYEPHDLNGWIPDFAIGYQPTLVEVKPFYRENEWKEAIEKIAKSGCDDVVVLLGADPTFETQQNPKFYDAPKIGWLSLPPHDTDPTLNPWPLNFGITEGNGRLGLCSMEGGWWNVIHSASHVDRDDHPNKWCRVSLDRDELHVLTEKWAEACNRSRWMPVKQ